MQTYIALLRGINVSGKKIIKMAHLKELMIAEGFQEVQTYIQSGNIVFEATPSSTKEVALSISGLIKRAFDFEVPVLVLTTSQLESIIIQNPLDVDKQVAGYFTLLHDEPSHELIKELAPLSNEKEEFVITSNCVYFYSAAGYGNAKFNNNFFEKKLKVTATTRNYKSMLKLLDMANIK
jgi:uncharacterized protein (DUF1697 family)